jgi:hypothetical protein
MTSIVLTGMGYIDYLAYRTILTGAIFCSMVAGNKLDVFSHQKKAVDEH